MENEIKFYTTADVRRILGIGNKTCLDLFHRSDFVSSFNEYVSTRRVLSEVNE